MLRREWRRALYALEGPPYCSRGGFYSIGISRRALVVPSGAEWGAISQRTRLYVVVKNREKRVTGGGGREIDVRQLEGGRRREIDVRQLERYGWRKCGSGCVLPVVSGFFTRCGAALHLTRAKHFTHLRF